MSKLVPALLAVVVVAGGAAALWLAGSGSDHPADEPPVGPAPTERPADPPPPAGDGPVPPPKEKPVRPPAAPRKWDEGPPLLEPVGQPVPGAALRFPFPQWPEAALVDWSQLGLVARKAQRQLRRAAIRIAEGESKEAVHAELIEAFLSVAHAAMPQFGPSLAQEIDPSNFAGSMLSFPPVESNTLAAVLDAWGRALTDEQVKKIQEIFRAHAAVWLENRPAPAQERTIENVLRVAKSRAAVQTGLEEILTESQRDALWPPETRGRVWLDLFSPATLLCDRVIVVQRDDEAETRLEIARRILAECALGHMPPERIEKPLAEWLDTMPDGWRTGRGNLFAKAELLTFDEVSPWLFELPRLLTSLETSGPRRDPRFHRLRKVIVPVK